MSNKIYLVSRQAHIYIIYSTLLLYIIIYIIINNRDFVENSAFLALLKTPIGISFLAMPKKIKYTPATGRSTRSTPNTTAKPPIYSHNPNQSPNRESTSLQRHQCTSRKPTKCTAPGNARRSQKRPPKEPP